MKTLCLILAGLAVAAVVLLAYIRLAPGDPARWNVDPLTAAVPGENGVLLRPGSPDGDVPVYHLTPQALLAAFDAHVAATPRLSRLTGGPGDGRITYVVRSKWMGFPDYVTVTAIPAPDGATLAILSRARFGSSDLGVNRARLQSWLQSFQPVTQ